MSETESFRREPDDDLPSQAAPGGQEDRGYCWIYSNVNGLNVRERPTTDSDAVGEINEGDAYWSTCRSYDGDRYNSCGGGDRWVAIWFRNRWRYVARRCVTIYGR